MNLSDFDIRQPFKQTDIFLVKWKPLFHWAYTEIKATILHFGNYEQKYPFSERTFRRKIKGSDMPTTLLYYQSKVT